MADPAHFNKAADAGPAHRWLHALNALLLIALWAFVIGAWPGLPDEVPAHIGPGGATRWTAKHNSPWFLLPIIATVNVAVLYGLATVANAGARGFNVPSKKRLLALPPDGQRYALQPMRGFLYAIAAWTLVLIGYVQLVIYRVAMAGRTAGSSTGGLLAFVVVMMGVFFAMMLQVTRATTRRIDEWERGEPR